MGVCTTSDRFTTCSFCFKKWLGIVSIAIMYNYIFIVGRAVFWDMQNMCPIVWLVLDYLCDLIYMLDMIVHAHEGVFYFLFSHPSTKQCDD